ncbi:hypothetical protein L3L93_003595 [Salmonella enterica]|nr:hypothetical protein [Salmonella enterica]
MSITRDFLKRVDEAPPAWSDNIIAERNINKYQKYSQFVRRESLRQRQIKPVTGASWLNRWFRRGAK